jgi:hypothetical protein
MTDAEIVNKVDLEWAKISFPLGAARCVFRDSIILSHGHFLFFGLQGGSVSRLEANGSQFAGPVFLRSGIKVEGGVDFLGAKIDGDLDCSDGQFVGEDQKPALNASGAEVKGAVFLRDGFRADGGVNLVAAKIDGSLACEGGKFISNGKTPALHANGAEVKGSVFLSSGFRAEGGVKFVATKIDGDLYCDRGQFVGNDRVPALDLRRARVGTLINSQDGWPTQGCLCVDGLVYDQIADKASPNAEVQLGWLQLQRRDRFLSQPFEQLASVLRKLDLKRTHGP